MSQWYITEIIDREKVIQEAWKEVRAGETVIVHDHEYGVVCECGILSVPSPKAP